MNLHQALDEVFKELGRVTRTEWRNRDIYLCMYESQLRTSWSTEQNRISGQMHPYILSESDYFAEDWEVVTDG